MLDSNLRIHWLILAEPKAMNTLIITEETRITDVTIQYEKGKEDLLPVSHKVSLSLFSFSLILSFLCLFTLTSENNLYFFILSILKLLLQYGKAIKRKLAD